MIVDFQHHYTPPELLEQGDAGILRLDEHGNPVYKLNPLLADLSAHIRMMDRAGIGAAVLSCGSGFDQTNIGTCRVINDRMRQAERDYPGRFIGLGHVPAFDAEACGVELKRCAVELGFPGVVIASELQGRALDAEGLRPFWRRCAELNLYVYIHPLPRVIAWPQMYVDDLGRMLGWEFSLMVAVVRLINSGLLDELPNLRVHVSHFGGGIGRYLPRIRGLQDRDRNGTASLLNHGRTPRRSFDHYLEERLVFDCCGWSSADRAAEEGAVWIRAGLAELPNSRIVFATDYPQGVQDDEQVARYVDAVRGDGNRALTMLDGADARFLIPDLDVRVAAQNSRSGYEAIETS
jgi:predicted TIM-barrel fold metal-dependent hydrolase